MKPEPPPKLGLALSGGGHRAAFFHIGVLAALAELGLLRQVRVLSTVSGGSCVGALYYLHIKRLLEERDDADIRDLDYAEIVRKVACEYQAAAAKNLLARAYLRPWLNFKMAAPWYSRTERAGELLERHFYRPAWNGSLVGGRIRMRDLLICPGGSAIDPDSDENAKRNAPVPILLLESTTLNTGHNWRFEAGYMGEPDRQSDVTTPGRQGDPTDVDKNELLVRAAWSDLPEPLQDFPLGRAVAASAAFPGGFTPVQIRNLYPDNLVVELTDGGVHDNQGVEGLLDRCCTHIVISDGSGQMPDVEKPGTWVPKVVSRVVSIYGDAEREQRLLRAFAEKRWAFFHLQTGLPNPIRTPGTTTREAPARTTTSDFDVDPEVQKRLARVRTNLDAFSELEAWALAKDGHAIAAYVTPEQEAIAALTTPLAEPVAWPWDAVELQPRMPRLLRVLEYGKWEIFGLAVPLLLIVAGLLSAEGYFFLDNGAVLLGISLGVLAAVGLYLGPELPLVRIGSAILYETVMPALLALPLFVAALVLWGTGRLWVHYGRLRSG